jgi:hypothetical protein
MAKIFYEKLGVQENATHEEIKRAYRLKAKALHPDVNKTRDTTREFQELQEAYSVLGSPERRKLYDEGNEVAAKSPETKATEADFDPFPCTSCQQISAQPRFISFYWVTSFIFFTYHRQCSGVYCPSCAAKRLFWSSLITGAIGWIGFPWGPAYFINALVYNIIGGKKDAEANALVLTKQALYFHNSGMPDVAAAIAAEALPYAQKSSKTSSGAACLNALGFFAGRKVVMNSKWNGISKPRMAALLGFLIPICAWCFFFTAKSTSSYAPTKPEPIHYEYKDGKLVKRTDAYTPSQPQLAPQQAPPLFNEPPQPLPQSGEVYTYPYSHAVAVAPFEIESSLGTNYLVKLADASTGVPVQTIFVRGGTKVSVKVPLGTFYVKYAAGGSWYGYQHLFGPMTAYSKANELFTFKEDFTGYTGYTITLHKVYNGNLKTQQIDQKDF